jgi:hypothetical protein
MSTEQSRRATVEFLYDLVTFSRRIMGVGPAAHRTLGAAQTEV